MLVPAAARGLPIEWPVASGGNGHFYTYISRESNWDTAVALASVLVYNGQQGYLATITSAAENDFIIDNFNQQGFLGGSDAAVEGQWRWVTGPEAGELFFVGEYPDPNRQTLIYADWGSNEPNDFDNTPNGFPYPGEDYLQFSPLRGGEWNDVPGDPYLSDGFYVEFAAPEPGGFVLWGMGLFGVLVVMRTRKRA
jgi:hypothetical protein